jgi:hypothetical protein
MHSALNALWRAKDKAKMDAIQRYAANGDVADWVKKINGDNVQQILRERFPVTFQFAPKQ